MAKIQGTSSFGQQNLRLGRSEGLSDFAKNLARQTTGNLRRATEAKMMGVASSAFGFLPPVMQASMFGLFTGGSGSSGSSGTVSRVGGSGTMQSTLWMTNLERLYREPLPVMIVTDKLGFIESQREKSKVNEGTSGRVDGITKKSGFGLSSLALAGLAGILSAALMKLKDTLENINITEIEWLKSILPNDLGDAASLGSKIVAAIGIGSLAKTLIFGTPTGRGGRKGGLLRNLRAVLLKSMRNLPWASYITTGMLAKAFGKMGLGLVQMAFDGIAGWFKSDEWGVDKLSGAIGAAIGGAEEGGTFWGSVSQGFKYAAIGAGIGSLVPGIGTLAGAVLGMVVGALIGWVGGKKIAQSLQNAFDNVTKDYTDTLKHVYNLMLPESIRKKKIAGKELSWYEHTIDFLISQAAAVPATLDATHQILEQAVGIIDPTYSTADGKLSEFGRRLRDEFGIDINQEGALRGLIQELNPADADKWKTNRPEDRMKRLKLSKMLYEAEVEKLLKQSSEIVIDPNRNDQLIEQLRKNQLENDANFIRGGQIRIIEEKMEELKKKYPNIFSGANLGTSLVPGVYDSIAKSSQFLEMVDIGLGQQGSVVIAPSSVSGGTNISQDQTIQVVSHGKNSHTDLMRPAWVG